MSNMIVIQLVLIIMSILSDNYNYQEEGYFHTLENSASLT